MDPLAVLQGHARVEQRWRLVGFGQELFQFYLSGFELLATLFHHVDRKGVAQIQIEDLL
ncbi:MULTISPECIES: hypothetical protein [Paracoccus]|uniref:hypothetical protein n=1 Tax=Paracoccus TaxID=265 RepID=UPI002EDAFFF4